MTLPLPWVSMRLLLGDNAQLAVCLHRSAGSGTRRLPAIVSDCFGLCHSIQRNAWGVALDDRHLLAELVPVPERTYSSNARWSVACSSTQSGSSHRIPLRPGTTRLGPAL